MKNLPDPRMNLTTHPHRRLLPRTQVRRLTNPNPRLNQKDPLQATLAPNTQIIPSLLPNPQKEHQKRSQLSIYLALGGLEGGLQRKHGRAKAKTKFESILATTITVACMPFNQLSKSHFNPDTDIV